MNQQLRTVACVATHSSKEVRGEKIRPGMKRRRSIKLIKRGEGPGVFVVLMS